ncbi:hypothetical protein ATCC90586_005245 [Pythium insidiosum]|nr:hypothetical protein ATCC90586_005245 [Pythium insidiosum]
MSVAAPSPTPPPAPKSPRTIALNRIPPELDRRLTACDAFVELMMKNDVLKHFRFFKTGQPPDIPHDPNFHLMADNGSVVAAMIVMLNISGYGVKIVDRAQLLARDSLRLATLRLAHEGDLRAVLKDLLRQNQRVKRDDVRKSRSGRKEDLPRRKFVQPVTRKRIAKVTVKAAEPAEADSSSDEDGVDSESDYDLGSIDSEADLSSSDGEEADRQALKAVGGVDGPTAEMIAKIFEATRTMQGGGGGQDRRQLPDRRVVSEEESIDSPIAQCARDVKRLPGDREDRVGSTPARVDMVRGDTDDGVARNLLAEIEEEAKEDEADSRVQGGTPAAEASLPVGGSPMVDAPPLVVDLTKETPQTQATRAMNEFPPRFPSDWMPVRALELLTAKNEVLKCLRVIKVAPSGEMRRDPGFAVMNDAEQIVRAIIGVFNTGGCSVAILDPHKLVSFPAKKVIEATAKSSIHDLVDGSELQRLAERYMGMSKDEATDMKEKVARQKAMIKSLGSYLQDMADEQARLRTALEHRGASMQQSAQVVAGSQGDRHGNVPTPASSSMSRPTLGDSSSTRRPASSVKETLSEMLGKTFPTTGVKAEADAKPTTLDAKLPLPGVKDAGKENPSTTDYLADIYEDCLAQMQGVSAATRLRQAAAADLKAFDGRSRNESRGKSWLNSFSSLLSDDANIWYRQLDRATRKSWPALQKAFELEYCGVSCTACNGAHSKWVSIT